MSEKEAAGALSAEQIEEAKSKRNKREQSIIKKEKEVQGIKERLYTLRFDSSKDKDEVLRDVKNLSNELKRLQKRLNKLREKSMIEFEQSLDLAGLGLSAKVITSGKPFATKENKRDYPINTHLQEEEIDLDDDTIDEKLMRTASTGTLDGQTPSERWQSLGRMFKEWRHHKTVADAQEVGLNEEDRALRQQEKAKLRAAIFSLQQKKNPSHSDQLLLTQLRARLRKLSSVKT